MDLLETIDQFQEEIISIRRVAKVVKGGKNLRFSVAVIVGNRQGEVGFGKGKAREVPLAIKKAVADARKNLIKVPIVNNTIPHQVEGKFGSTRVIIRPASPGTGVIAGSAVRVILELAGVENILTKILYSKNPYSVARATIEGLKKLRTKEQVKMIRQGA